MDDIRMAPWTKSPLDAYRGRGINAPKRYTHSCPACKGGDTASLNDKTLLAFITFAGCKNALPFSESSGNK